MAIAEQEITQKLTLSLTQAQAEEIRLAAETQGQSAEEFTLSASVQAASAVLIADDTQALPPAKSFASVLGIFQDEPLMDALMERIQEERTRQAEQEAE